MPSNPSKAAAIVAAAESDQIGYLDEPKTGMMLHVEAIRNVCAQAGIPISAIEGIASPAGLHPLQQAYLEDAALQCGICTPGFLVASKALLDSEPEPSEGRIRLWLAGNLCRCTGYDKIVRAVQHASSEMAEARR